MSSDAGCSISSDSEAGSGAGSQTSNDASKPLVPIIVQNPDGSMSEGVPPGYKEKLPPPSPRSVGADGLFGGLDAAGVHEELLILQSRHERMFIALIVVQFFVEMSFNTLYVLHADESLREIEAVYGADQEKVLIIMLWVTFGIDIAFGLVYYSLGWLAACTNRPRYYMWFATACMCGILGQVLMAYINKFNLLIFFMRLLSYIYAKFLRSLAIHMQIVPPNAGREQTAR
jgi:hypothetical protein